ncbi:hypothetical protein ACHCPG_001998 [Enterococcus hirae]
MKKNFLITLSSFIVLTGVSYNSGLVLADSNANISYSNNVSSDYQHIKNEINELYVQKSESSINKTLNNTVTQNKLNQLVDKVNQLANSKEKQLLIEELKDIEHNLSEIQIKTKNNEIIAQIDAINNNNNIDLYVRTFANDFRNNQDVCYGEISFKEKLGNRIRPIFNKTYKGGRYVTSVKKLRRSGKNEILVVTSNEAPLEVNSTVDVPNLSTGTYEFKLNDSTGHLELISFNSNH